MTHQYLPNLDTAMSRHVMELQRCGTVLRIEVSWLHHHPPCWQRIRLDGAENDDRHENIIIDSTCACCYEGIVWIL